MINVGLIGKINRLEPFYRQALKHSSCNIIGKSSIGTPIENKKDRIPVPEFNRLELIERSDALLINNFELLPFQMLCEIVKKSKHIFATTYPLLNKEQCIQIIKLSREARTIIQVINPFYFLPPLQWLNFNIQNTTYYIEINYFEKKLKSESELLFYLLLMLKNLLKFPPKKTEASAYNCEEIEQKFYNARINFLNGSSININYGQNNKNKQFIVKSFSHNQFIKIDINRKEYTKNNKTINLSQYKIKHEIDSFLNSIITLQATNTNIEDYYTVLQIVNKINKKLNRYNPY